MPDSKSPVVVFLVPAYNEASRIGSVLSSILHRGYKCLVVDDASEDGTADIVRQYPVELIRHGINLGQGAALRTGMEYLSDIKFDYLVTFDSDGQHSVKDAETLLEIAERTKVEVVLGSRFLFKNSLKEVPFHRKLVLRLGVLFTRVHTGLDVTDTHNGLRVLSRRASKRIRLTQPRMAHASEILKGISESELSWSEGPVTIAYSAETFEKGQKSFSGAIDILLDLVIGRLR